MTTIEIPLKVVHRYGYSWTELDKDKDTKTKSASKDKKNDKPYHIELMELYGGLQ